MKKDVLSQPFIHTQLNPPPRVVSSSSATSSVSSPYEKRKDHFTPEQRLPVIHPNNYADVLIRRLLVHFLSFAATVDDAIALFNECIDLSLKSCVDTKIVDKSFGLIQSTKQTIVQL